MNATEGKLEIKFSIQEFVKCEFNELLRGEDAIPSYRYCRKT